MTSTEMVENSLSLMRIHTVLDKYAEMSLIPLSEIIRIDDAFTSVVTYRKYSI